MSRQLHFKLARLIGISKLTARDLIHVKKVFKTDWQVADVIFKPHAISYVIKGFQTRERMMTTFMVYRAVQEGAEIDAQPEWWVVDLREEEERDGDLVRKRCATKPEADEAVNELNKKYATT
ncbi:MULTISPECIES: hypothetical protein [Halomonas]|uniref:hypothetical protein n=1 Tax=Halomonas TaxID=2745 RepID=UPI001D012D66|nr:hypothetical protein [Halomonas citrativorans]